MYQLYRDRPFLVLCMVFANATLSLWSFNIDPVINNDGVTYLHLAQFMLDGQWAEAFEIYSWPYYSAFIAGFSQITMFGPETAAYILNTIFATSLTLAFVCIVAELSNNNKRIILIAMLVILFFPSITKYRSFIIRDFGYLSCYLWSLYFIFRFCSTLNKRHLVGWLVFAALSCLFRFEGIAFILIAPYFLFLFTARDIPYRKLIMSSLSISLIICAVWLTIWYVNDKYAGLIAAANADGKSIDNVFELFLMTTEESVGGESLTVWATCKAIFSNLGSVLYELVRRMAIFYFFFAIYAYIKNIGFKNDLIKRTWLVYVVCNLSMLAAYSIYNNFLVSRYTMASALTLLLLSPFIIDRIINGFQDFSVGKKTFSIVAILVLSIISLEGLDVRTKKEHIREAGLWVKNNIPDDATFFSNDPLVVYYAGRGYTGRLNDAYSTLHLREHMDKRTLKRFDYVALSINPKDYWEDLSRQTLWYEHGLPEKIINGVGERAVFIFKIRKRR